MNRGRITTVASIFTPVAIGLTVGLAVLSGGASGSTRGAATGSTRGAATGSTRGAATGSTSSAHAVTTGLTVRAATPKFVFIGCDNNAEVAPSSTSNCGDGAVGLQGLHWMSWTPHLASGYGTYFLNDCTPTCAGGHFHAYPALVDLWGSAAVSGHPSERKYTQMTLIFTGTRPPFYQLVNGKTVVTHPGTLTLPTFP